VIAALVGVLAAYVFGPGQAVNAQQAVEDHQRSEAARGPAVAARVSFDYGDVDGYTWVAPRPIDPTGKLKVLPKDAIDKVKSAGGFQVGFTSGGPPGQTATRLRITLVGRWFDGVVVDDLTARFLKRSAPLDTSLFYGPSQGAGDTEQLGFDLDSADLTAREATADGKLGAHYRSRRFITLKQNEPVVINAIAVTQRCYCEWVIDVTVTDLKNSRSSQIVTIDDNGKPFRSTALANKYQEEFNIDSTGGVWARTDQLRKGHP
jgi:hypothetical protein